MSITAELEPKSGISNDLTPIVVEMVIDTDRNREFTLRPALKLTPKSDDESRGELLFVEEPSIKLSACAATRSELEDELKATLIFLWDEYAEVDDQALTLDARELKASLRARMTVKGSH